MLNYVYKFTACGEEVFMRDKDGYETWVYSCNTCEEAENKAKNLQRELMNENPEKIKRERSSQYEF